MHIKLTHGIIGNYNEWAIASIFDKHLHEFRGVVLDVGCGRMRYKPNILSEKKVTQYVGLDLVESDTFKYTVKPDVSWDGITMPLADNSIDTAVCFEVLEHCDDPSIVVRETFRVLKPGATVFFHTPFLYQLHGIPYDFQRLTPFGIEKLFRDAGFSQVHTEASGSIDSSLGQMIAMWILHRPMSLWARRILRRLFVPIYRTLLRWDAKRLTASTGWKENDMPPGVLGWAVK